MQTQSIDGNINSPERSKERDYLLATSPPPGVSNAVPSSNEETRREKLRKFFILSSLFTAYLLISAAYSILSPFYPQEAERYGLGVLGVGLVMGTSPLCVVILSPILGYFIPEIGLKFMLISGSFLVGGSFVLLGFLIDMYSRFEFILFSVLLRVVEGIGSAGYATALFTMATVLYPKSTGTVIGILEVGSGIGFVAGPPLGGLLYNLGGFLLPFVVTGGLVLLFIPVFIIFLPNAQGKKQFIPPKAMLKLFSDVPFLVLCLDNIVLIGALGVFAPTLSPFLEKKFHLSQLGIGLVFLCGPSFYLVSSFAAGKLSDLFGPRYFIVGGFIISGIAFFFLGPAEFITTNSYLWTTCVALCFVGIGLGFGVVPVYSDMLEIAKRVSPNTDQETLNGMISGLSSSTLGTGEFLGPIIGGALTQALSFQTASMIFGQVLVAKGLLLLGITLIDRFARRSSILHVKINE